MLPLEVKDMPASKAQQKAVSKYMKENYDVYQIRMKKGQKDTIKAHAAAQGESMNGFIGRAIGETMERDGPGSPSEAPKLILGAGVASLTSETLEAAQKAAEAVGEGVPQFVARAVTIQAQRDQTSLKLGINPATGEKLKGEA